MSRRAQDRCTGRDAEFYVVDPFEVALNRLLGSRTPYCHKQRLSRFIKRLITRYNLTIESILTLLYEVFEVPPQPRFRRYYAPAQLQDY